MSKTTQTLTLTDFLLARIAEDEEAARQGMWHDIFCASANPPNYPCDCTFPKRMVAECEAKRRIVEQCAQEIAEVDLLDTHDNWVGTRSAVLAEALLEHLASPYSDHPDYREEWKP